MQPGQAFRIGITPYGLKNMNSQLFLEIGADLNALVTKNSALKHLPRTSDLFKMVAQEPSFYAEVEYFFEQKIRASLAELDAIADEERKRKATIFSVLNRAPALRKY
jgi:hypothetical protein